MMSPRDASPTLRKLVDRQTAAFNADRPEEELIEIFHGIQQEQQRPRSE
jgi:NADH:ubiquinone oxidoreductase subunit E